MRIGVAYRSACLVVAERYVQAVDGSAGSMGPAELARAAGDVLGRSVVLDPGLASVALDPGWFLVARRALGVGAARSASTARECASAWTRLRPGGRAAPADRGAEAALLKAARELTDPALSTGRASTSGPHGGTFECSPGPGGRRGP